MGEVNKQKKIGFTTKLVSEADGSRQRTHRELVPPIFTSTTFFQDDPTDPKVNF